MRGDKSKEQDEAIEKRAQLVAKIIDENGRTVYRVVSTRWTQAYLICMIVILIVSLITLGLVYSNTYRIHTIEKETLDK